MTHARRERPVRVAGHLEREQLCPGEPDLPGKHRAHRVLGRSLGWWQGARGRRPPKLLTELLAGPRMGAEPHPPHGPAGSCRRGQPGELVSSRGIS